MAAHFVGIPGFSFLAAAALLINLQPKDRQRLIELLNNRPLRFCLFLSALFGEKQMEILMTSAIRTARQLERTRRGLAW